MSDNSPNSPLTTQNLKSDNAIIVKNLTKVYPLYDNPKDRLKEALNPFKKSYHHDFYALKDVSFEIKKGETVGIIGKNGAGKSTLLKIITGVLTPTSGEVHVDGKIASLLELGAGFNPEMTGMENIYLNGTIMGFTKEEMDEKVDAILSFADIGEFIDQPVKMYSSGVFARLAFSVAINVEPDILIVDEVLSVGDEKFQRKCFAKIEQMSEQGCTILFVTHSTSLLEKICTVGLLFSDGKLIEAGLSKDVVEAYRHLLYGTEVKEKKNKEISSKNGSTVAESYKQNITVSSEDRAKITAVWMTDATHRKKKEDFLSHEKVIIGLEVKAFEDIEEMIAGIRIKTIEGVEVFGASSDYISKNIHHVKAGKSYIYEFNLDLGLCDGSYFVTFAIAKKDRENEMLYLDKHVDIILFKIVDMVMKYAGIAALKYTIDLQE